MPSPHPRSPVDRLIFFFVLGSFFRSPHPSSGFIWPKRLTSSRLFSTLLVSTLSSPGYLSLTLYKLPIPEVLVAPFNSWVTNRISTPSQHVFLSPLHQETLIGPLSLLDWGTLTALKTGSRPFLVPFTNCHLPRYCENLGLLILPWCACLPAKGRCPKRGIIFCDFSPSIG